MRDGLYGEAGDSAAEYIRTLLASPDADRRDWARALIRLGHAQRMAHEYAAAAGNYELAIKTLEDETDRLNATLIEPTRALADVLVALGNPVAAAQALERTLHLQQVNNGPLALSQAKTLQALAEIYLLLGDSQRALARQQTVSAVYERNFPGNDVRKLPAMRAEASMLAELGLLVDAHTKYRRTIAMVERADGTRSPHLLDAIYELANFLASNSIMDGYDGYTTARRFMQRAVYIADRGDRVTDLQRADAHIAMGDFLMTFTTDTDAAMRRYSEAWTILAAKPRLAEALQQRFGAPRLLNEVPAGTSPIMRNLIRRLEHADADTSARVLVRFDVEADGRPQNIDVIEGDPSGYWNQLVLHHVSMFRFRPRLDDGQAIAVADVVWNVPYRLRDADLLD